MKETFAAWTPGSVNDPEAVLNRSEKIVSETVIQPEKSHEGRTKVQMSTIVAATNLNNEPLCRE
jgi:hypothetical protein